VHDPKVSHYERGCLKNVVAHLVLCQRHKLKFELFSMLLLYLPFGQNWAILPDESGNYRNLGVKSIKIG